MGGENASSMQICIYLCEDACILSNTNECSDMQRITKDKKREKIQMLTVES